MGSSQPITEYFGTSDISFTLTAPNSKFEDIRVFFISRYV